MPMADEIGTIVLAGEKIPVQALTLDQLQASLPLLGEYYGAINAGTSVLDPAVIKLMATIISTAVGRPSHDIRAGVDELEEAIAVIAEVTGLIRLGERKRAALEAMASNGTASTPTS